MAESSASTQSALFQKAKSLYTSRLTIWLIIGFGALCRVSQYIANRSIDHNEGALTINLLQRSFSGLLKPLNNFQYSPYGFLFIEKFCVTILGTSEYAMRFFPLICGIAAIFIFYKLTLRVLDKNAVPIALLLFVAASGPNLFSSDVKHFSSDIMIAGALLLLGLDYSRRNSVLALAGAIAIWFSPAAVFILAGLGVSAGAAMLLKKELRKLGGLLSIFAVWLASFAIYYKLHLAQVVANGGYMQYWWHDSFAPLPPHNLHDWQWYLHAFIDPYWHMEVLGYPRFAILAVTTTLIGAISLYKRDKVSFFTLTLPILLALLASGLQKYFFKDRCLLFLSPAILILLSEGFYVACILLNKLWRPLIIGGIAFIILFLYFPLKNAAATVCGISCGYKSAPIGWYQEVRPLLEYLSTHYQKGDKLLVHPWARYGFRHYKIVNDYKFDYKICDTINDEDILDRKVNEDEDMIKEIDALAGNKRVWFLFVRFDDPSGTVEKCLKHLEQNWHKIEEREEPGAYLCLYDMSK